MIFYVQFIFCQPVIDNTSHIPLAGEKYQYRVINALSEIPPGETGRNVVWDFSEYTSNLKAEYKYLDPANTAFAGKIKENVLGLLTDSEYPEGFTFYRFSSTMAECVAGGWEMRESVFYYEYTDPLVSIIFPYHYNDSYKDTFLFILDYNPFGGNIRINVKGIVQSRADAWGFLKCAGGNYPSVLRIRSDFSEIITTYFNEIKVNCISSTTTDFNWYDPGIKVPVLMIRSTNGGDVKWNLKYLFQE